MVKGLNQSIAAQFYERYGDVQAFALNAIWQQENISTHAATEILNNYAELYGIYDLIVYLDTEGHVKYMNSIFPNKEHIKLENDLNINLSKTLWFADLSSGKLSNDEKKNFHGTYVLDLVNDDFYMEITKTQNPCTIFAAPIFKESKVIGYMINFANIKWYFDEISTFEKKLTNLGLKQFLLRISNHDSKSIGTETSLREKNDNFKKVILNENVYEQFKINTFSKKQTFNDENNSSEKKIALLEPMDEAKFLTDLQWKTILIGDEKELFNEVYSYQKKFYWFISVLLIVALIGLYPLIQKLSDLIQNSALKLVSLVEYNKTLIDEFNISTQKLLETSQEQDAAVQQTVSSVSEISSMIQMTSENMNSTISTSTDTQQVVCDGQKTMKVVNEQMGLLLKANEKLKNISQVIQSISNQTQIINDIVFKTQLLSFNASIEAARAGESGRGFSVVADEVGLLSINSGKAAHDIEKLIQESQIHIDSTLDELTKLITESVYQVEESTQKFSAIEKSINNIDMQMKHIEEATSQQKLGVENTQLAMLGLSESVKQNTVLSSEFAQKFTQLSAKTLELNEESLKLKKLVEGKLNSSQNAA